jgi:hypothetical protein
MRDTKIVEKWVRFNPAVVKIFLEYLNSQNFSISIEIGKNTTLM